LWLPSTFHMVIFINSMLTCVDVKICQFCYNNIKTTMNGLCPACRRPYDETNIEWKVVSPEEYVALEVVRFDTDLNRMAQHKLNIAQQAKKKAAAKQKEAQKREADHLSRKHLAGLRVRQKNLVYVTGLKPRISGDKLVESLRSKDFFGQYGDIIKVVVSKSKDGLGSNQPIGIYVTYARKDDASLCIATIDGHKQPDGSRVRAQYGTTKYCSAYLRNDTCTNRNCMFLHEPGEDSESFTRQDLSSLNASSSQHMGPPQGLVSHSPQPLAFAQPLPLQAFDDVATASPTDEGPALPATANWGDQARRLSRTTTNSAASPQVANSLPVIQAEETQESSTESSEPSIAESSTSVPKPSKKFKPRYPFLEDVARKAFDPAIQYHFALPAHFSEKDRWVVENFPPLFDLRHKPKRGVREVQAQLERELLQRQALEQSTELKDEPLGEHDETDHAPPGSSQLGGEPEERLDRSPFPQGLDLSHHHAIGHATLGHNLGLGEDLAGLGARGMGGQVTSQQQQLLLQKFKIGNLPTANHGRQPSRFFVNEVMGAAASKNLAKQQANFGHQQFSGAASPAFPFTTAQGPPPGLKTTGTPPVTGGGMFAQGHGFTQGVGYLRDGDRMWETAHRTRAGVDSKRELIFPSASSYQQYSTAGATAGMPQGFPYGNQGVAGYPDMAGGSQQLKQQKKKGKKHRHANTSSSGGLGAAGAGVASDLDSGMLQMRLGGNSGAPGQVFGGQAGFGGGLHVNAYRGW
jgi:CCR4-NOT transcription complex subunit 4